MEPQVHLVVQPVPLVLMVQTGATGSTGATGAFVTGSNLVAGIITATTFDGDATSANKIKTNQSCQCGC